MPDLPARMRRTALEVLGRDRLARVTDEYGLAVEDRRSQATHVAAILRARSLDFGHVAVSSGSAPPARTVSISQR